MRNLEKNNAFYLCMLYMLSFSILGAIYVYYIAPVWEYMGFELAIDRINIFISIFVLLFFAFIIPAAVSVRSFFLHIALTIQLLPSLVLFAFGGKPLHSAIIIWIALLIVITVSAIKFPRLSFSNASPKHLMQGLALVTAVLIAGYFSLGGLANFNLDIRLVYDFRTEAAKALPPVFAYLTPIFSKVVIPFGVTVSLYYKKRIWLASFFFFSFLMFGFTGHKSILFFPVISASIYYLIGFRNKYAYVLLGVILILLIGAIDAFYYLSSDGDTSWGLFASIFVRRGLLLPALLDYHYLEFFADNERLTWATSRLTFGLIPNPYDAAVPNLIGEIYFANPETAANTGYIGSGFAQAGLLGVILYASGAGFVIAALDSYGRYLGLPFVAAITTGQIATMFIGSDFVTLFLTHGMLVSFILLSMVGRPQEDKEPGIARAAFA